MEIGVLGTGMVGRALTSRLTGLGHDVAIGTREVEQTLARTESSLRLNTREREKTGFPD